MRRCYYLFINFFKDFLKVCLKTSSSSEKHFALPLILLIVNILPFMFLPIISGKAIISTNYGLLYLLFLMPLNGIIIFFHSLLSKSNILCISGLKSGLQGLNFALILLFSVLSVSMNYSSLNIETIETGAISLINFVLELPIAFLYFLLILVFDNSFLGEYSKEYTGICSWIFKMCALTFPIKEIMLFVILFLEGGKNPFSHGDFSITYLLIKTVIVFVLFKLLSTNIPKLRADQIIELFMNRIFIFAIFWLILKSIIIYG